MLTPREKNESVNTDSITFLCEPENKVDLLTACHSLDTDYSKVFRVLLKKFLEENSDKIKNPKSQFLIDFKNKKHNGGV